MPEFVEGGYGIGPLDILVQLNLNTAMNVDLLPTPPSIVTLVDGISVIEFDFEWISNGTIRYKIPKIAPAIGITVQFTFFGVGMESEFGWRILNSGPFNIPAGTPPIIYY